MKDKKPLSLRRIGPVFKGRAYMCPDCGKDSLFSVGSTGGIPPGKQISLDRDMALRVFQYFRANKGEDVRKRYVKDERGQYAHSPDGAFVQVERKTPYVACRCASKEVTALFWIELDANSVAGPWCRYCFKKNEAKLFGEEHTQDLRVMIAPVRGILGTLDDEDSQSETEPEDQEEDPVVEASAGGLF